MRFTKLASAALIVTLVNWPGVGRADPVALQNATATFSQTLPYPFSVGLAIDGSFSGDFGWAVLRVPGDTTTSETAVFETVADLGFAGGTNLTFTLSQLFSFPSQHNIGRFRLSATTDPRSAFADGLATGGDVTANWTVLHPLSATSTGGTILTILGDDSILASGPNPATSVYTVTASTSLIGITGFRLEVLEDPSLPFGGPGRQPQNGNFVLTEFQIDAVPAGVVIPEPSTWTLLSLGAFLLFGYRRRLPAASSCLR